MKEFYGNYLGVVITGGEKDPEHRGRSQVFVPHIMPALYEQWNKEGKDISFEVIGTGLDGALDPQIVNRLRDILPWAECAAPIVGASPSYKGSVGGFVSETLRNVGAAVNATTDAIKNTWNNLAGNSESEDSALGVGLAGYFGSVDRNEAGYCGRGVRNLLINAYGYSESEIPGANGQDFGPILEKQGWTKEYVSDPKNAPDGAIAVYPSDQRLKKPLTRRKDGTPTGGATAGHVGVIAGGKEFFGAGGGKNNPGGSQLHNYPGYVYVPPPEIKQRLLKKAGLPVPNVSPSAVPYHETNTSNMNPDITNEKGLSENISLSLQETPESISLNEKNNSNISGLSPNEIKFAMRIAATESGAGILDAKNVYNNMTNAAQRVGYAYNPAKYFGRERYSESELEAYGNDLISSGKVDWKKVDIGYVQSNEYDKTQKGAVNSGSYIDQITGTALAIRNLSAKNPVLGKKVLDSINSGDFKEADRILGSKNSKETIGTKYFGLVDHPQKANDLIDKIETEFNGDVNEALKKINSELHPIPTIAELSSGSFTPQNVTSTANYISQPTIKNPTPHQGISGPNTNNQALGMFGYASEGQAVWVFFREGNPLCPVYFAASFGSKEWGGIYQNQSNAIGSGTPGTEKTVINLYGGTMTSFTSTEESPLGANFGFQLSDRNGSNLTFAKDHTQFNSLYNHVQRVAGDSHDITETNKEVRVKGNYNTVTEQDLFITVGNWSQEALDASDEIQKIINEGMKLYEDS